jgi:hypothetical protein
MKSTLSSKFAAAALLLVPVGAMLVAQPAAAEHRDYRDDRGYGYGWDRDSHRDHRAPRIFDVTPENGDRVGDRGWTRISARFHDRGAGVGAVTLRVDGRDVTGRARVDADDIRYAENLQPGRHVAELVVRDRAGNATRHAWSFDVVDTHRGYGRSYGQYGYASPASRW